MAFVVFGRFPQACLHPFDTPAKNIWWLDNRSASTVITSRFVSSENHAPEASFPAASVLVMVFSILKVEQLAMARENVFSV